MPPKDQSESEACERRKNPDCAAMLAKLLADSTSAKDNNARVEEAIRDIKTSTSRDIGVVFERIEKLKEGDTKSREELAGIRAALNNLNDTMKVQAEILKALPDIQKQNASLNFTLERHATDITELKAQMKSLEETKAAAKSWARVATILVAVATAIATAIALKITNAITFAGPPVVK